MFHMPMSSPMMTTMFGRCCAGGCACALADPVNESDISVAAPISAAQDLVCKPLIVLRKMSRILGGLSLSMHSDMVLPSCLQYIDGSSLDAPKADMARGSIDRLRVARSRPVAAAVVRRAEMRAALDHLSGNLDVRQRGVVAVVLPSAAWIFGDAARFRRVGLVLRRIPVRRPFPDVADHVVDAVAVRRERRHRRSALEAVLTEVLVREFALPDVGHVTAAGREFVAPGKFGTVKPAARRVFPLCLRRQVLVGPLRVGERV